MSPMKAPARIAAVTVTTTLWVLATAAVAAADAPAGGEWPDVERTRGILDWLLYFGGASIGLFVVVGLFGLLTARNNYVPPPPGTDLEVRPTSEPVPHDEQRTV